MWLYSIYSIPNILIPLIGGLMIDKLGARVIMVVTAGICCLGQAVFFSGGYKNLFWLMLVGK
jgi:MFS family permease